MKNIIVIVILAVLLILGFRAFSEREVVDTVPVPTQNVIVATTTPVSVNPYADEITISSPVANALVSSPFEVTGRARGPWYFEASAPVQVQDATGKVIGQGHVEAQGDWMTTEFVPFKGTITFSTPTTATGTIVFMNDNPSGDPERSKSVKVPVRFK